MRTSRFTDAVLIGLNTDPVPVASLHAIILAQNWRVSFRTVSPSHHVTVHFVFGGWAGRQDNCRVAKKRIKRTFACKTFFSPSFVCWEGWQTHCFTGPMAYTSVCFLLFQLLESLLTNNPLKLMFNVGDFDTHASNMFIIPLKNIWTCCPVISLSTNADMWPLWFASRCI